VSSAELEKVVVGKMILPMLVGLYSVLNGTAKQDALYPSGCRFHTMPYRGTSNIVVGADFLSVATMKEATRHKFSA